VWELFLGEIFLGGNLFFGGRERVEEGVCGVLGGYIHRERRRPARFVREDSPKNSK
jgi:hypothetical protein